MTNTWPGWQNVSLIGEGSFGKVYKIQREEFGQVYEAALKVITIPASKADIRTAFDEGMDEESVTDYFRSFVEDIVAEFALMSKLKGNSNIVSYEDHMVVQHEGEIGWDILIRMELLTALPDYTAKHPLQEADIIRLGQDLARALELCRKEGIIHRDIKPENIFVSKNGDFKLGDFGVARVAEKTISAMSRKGTYNYMAPEVYKGQEYGYTADLYSLGLVLYRFLNDNRTPFLPPYPQRIQYSDKEQALNNRMAGKPIPVPVHGSKGLQEVVLKACAFQPGDRYASAEEMGRALSGLWMEAGAVREEATRQEREAAEVKAREEAARQEREAEEARLREEAARQEREVEEARVREEAARQEKEAEEARVREEAARQEREAEEARLREEAARQEREAQEARIAAEGGSQGEEDLERTVSAFSSQSVHRAATDLGQEVEASGRKAEQQEKEAEEARIQEEAARQEKEAEEARLREEAARQKREAEEARKAAEAKARTVEEAEDVLEKTVSVFSGKGSVSAEGLAGTENHAGQRQEHLGKADETSTEGRGVPAKASGKKPWYQKAWVGTLVLPIVVWIEYVLPNREAGRSSLYRAACNYPAGQGGSFLLFGILSAIMAVLALLWKKMWEVQKGQKNFYAAGFGILTGVLFFLRCPIAAMTHKGWGFQMVNLQYTNLWIGIVLGAVLVFGLDLWRNQMACKKNAAVSILCLVSYHCLYLAGFLLWWVLAGLYSRSVFYGERAGWWTMFTVFQFRHGAWTAGLVIAGISLAAGVVLAVIARKKE